jgi:hypothetical protein
MRKLPLLLVFLLALLAAAGPAQALSLPAPLTLLAEEEGEEPEEEASEEPEEEGEGESEEPSGPTESEDEECEWFVEEGENCGEATRKAKAEELAEAEECVLKDASATVAANPGSSTVRLTIRYKAYKPSAVAVDSRLRGNKGGLHLGTTRARFRQAGVFHDSFGLSKKEMARALAAREFAIDLQAVNTPASCALHLAASRGGGHKRLWS